MLGLGIFTKGENEATMDAANISHLIERLKTRYPLIKEKLCDPKTGRLYPGFEILVNEQPIINEEQELNNGDIVTILPIFAGG
jgi:molybdopterin converting factor small subunit